MDIIQPIITAIYFVFGSVLLFLAYNIVRDNLANRQNKIAGLMLFFAALGPILLAFGAIVRPNMSAEAPFEESVVYNFYYIWELFYPAFLLFSWVFPIDRLSRARWPRLRYLIFLPQIFHLFLAVVFLNPDKILNLLDVESGEGFISLILEPLSYLLKWLVLGFTLILSSEKTLFSFINLSYTLFGLYFIIRGWTQINNKEIKKQSAIIIGGLASGIFLLIYSFLLPDIFAYELSETIQSVLLIIALFIGAGTIIWAIIRYRFLDVTVMVRQSLVYTITSGILVGMYILLVSQADRMITSLFGEKTTIVNIAFIVVALILYQPINNRLDNLVKRFFIKNRTDYRNILEQLSRRLISVLDPPQLRDTIESTLKSTLLVERIYFVLFDDKQDDYVLLPSEDFADREIIDREDRFLGGVNQLDGPAMINRLSLYRQDSKLADAIERRKIKLILPLKDADHLLGFLALSRKASGFSYNAEDLTMLGVISNQLVTVLTNARLYIDSLEKQQLEKEMAMAREIQLDLLPKKLPHSEFCRIGVFSMPSRLMGGDFYDFIDRGDDSFGMVIADASGKGLPAALLVAQIQAMLRAEVGHRQGIADILRNINNHVAELTSSEKYATLFYGEYDYKSGRFCYSNAGHNYPILVRADGSIELLSTGGMVIGAFSGAQYEDNSVTLNKDDLLFMYTDGLSEAMNGDEEEYGEQRVIDYLIKNHHLDCGEIIDGLMKDVRAFDPTDPPSDDTTLIVLKASGGK